MTITALSFPGPVTSPAAVPVGKLRGGPALASPSGSAAASATDASEAALATGQDLSLDALAALSKEEVKDALLTWAGRVAAGEARLLAHVGELDAREAWADWGVLSCAHWLSWRLGWDLRTARERVRVARALRDLPLTAGRFHSGGLSYSQVRAITRVATVDTERRFVELAGHATGSQLDRLCRGVRRATHAIEDAKDREAAAHRLRSSVVYDDDGTMLLTLRLPAEQGAVVLAAIEAACADLDHQREHAAAADAEDNADADGDLSAARPTDVEPARLDPWGQAGSAEPSVPPADPPVRTTRGEALVHLARMFLDHRGRERPGAARRSRSQLHLMVDPLSGWARLPDGEVLPPGVSAPLLRDVTAWGLRSLTAGDLTVHDHGRNRREPDLALRELLGQADGERCRFPSCTRRRKLHAHHVRFWSDGGRTDLANLVLLCSRHHTLVHAHGYRLTLHPDRTLDVTTAGGEHIEHRPPLPWRSSAELDPEKRIDNTTLPPHVTDRRLDLHHAVFVLMQHAA